MTWLRRGSYPQAERKLYFDTVRLCFAQTFTKEEYEIREERQRDSTKVEGQG
jgi:hypothetical protein